MRKLFLIKAHPWIGNHIVSTYKVCANSTAEAKAAVKKQPELNTLLYNESDFRVTQLGERTEGWKTNEVRRIN